MAPDRTDPPFADLSSLLWRERQLLDLLTFKLQVEQLVLANGHARWLGHASREVELVVERLRETEILRALESSRVAGAMRMPAEATLRSLAEAAPDPWDAILGGHRHAFLEAVAEVTRLAEVTRDLAGAQRDLNRRTIEWLAGREAEPTTYDAGGGTARSRSGHLLFNQAL